MASYCPACNRHLRTGWQKHLWAEDYACPCGARITSEHSPLWIVLVAGSWAGFLSFYLPTTGWDTATRAMAASLSSALVLGIAHLFVYRPKLVRKRDDHG